MELSIWCASHYWDSFYFRAYLVKLCFGGGNKAQLSKNCSLDWQQGEESEQKSRLATEYCWGFKGVMTSHPEFTAARHEIFILMKRQQLSTFTAPHSIVFVPYRVDLLLCHPTIQENRLLLCTPSVSPQLSIAPQEVWNGIYGNST